MKSGRLRAIAVTGAKRSLAAPDLPTVAEAAFPGFEAVTWYGLFVPAGTPAAIIARLNAEGRPAIFYLHPWEIDPEQPRVRGVKLKTRFRHYINLHRTEERLARLLADFRWDTVRRAFTVDAP